MDSHRDDEPDEPHFGSPEWDNRLEERRGHPKGDWVRPSREEDLLNANVYARSGAETAIVDELQRRLSAPDKKPFFDWSLNIPVLVSVMAMAASGLVGYVRLGDQVENSLRRLEIVEKQQGSNTSRGEAQEEENKLQDQRIQNIVTAAADERKARNDANADEQKGRTEILSIISRLMDRVNDLVTEQAIQKDRQGRGHTELSQPERDAALPARPH